MSCHRYYKKKDQDIASVMNLVQVSKKRLQVMRESKWSYLLDEVSHFCDKHGIDLLKMDEMFIT